jgi:hypothetical protein
MISCAFIFVCVLLPACATFGMRRADRCVDIKSIDRNISIFIDGKYRLFADGRGAYPLDNFSRQPDPSHLAPMKWTPLSQDSIQIEIGIGIYWSKNYKLMIKDNRIAGKGNHWSNMGEDTTYYPVQAEVVDCDGTEWITPSQSFDRRTSH